MFQEGRVNMKIIMCGAVINKKTGKSDFEEVEVTSDESEVIITFKDIEVRLDKINFKKILHIV
jgi:hypothetical protein